MPIVQIHLIKGRTVEQKRSLVKKVTDAVCETVNVPADAVEVILSEMERENYARAGALHLDQKK
jgi:4-oxalocrotonate tautomerase